jgi:energy-coupling factor transporter transmembrane protein EcfT
MVTAREKVNIKSKLAVRYLVVGWIILLIGFIGKIYLSWFWPLMILGTVIIIIPVFYLNFLRTCPVCGRTIGLALAMHSTLGGSISKYFKFCPFCGFNLDQELNDIPNK